MIDRDVSPVKECFSPLSYWGKRVTIYPAQNSPQNTPPFEAEGTWAPDILQPNPRIRTRMFFDALVILKTMRLSPNF